MTIRAHNLASSQQPPEDDDDATMTQIIETIDAAFAAIERVKEDVSERVARCIAAVGEEREARIVDTAGREARHTATVVAEREARRDEMSGLRADFSALRNDLNVSVASAAHSAYELNAMRSAVDADAANRRAEISALRNDLNALVADMTNRQTETGALRNDLNALVTSAAHASTELNASIAAAVHSAMDADMANRWTESSDLRSATIERMTVIEERHGEVARSVDRVATQATVASGRTEELRGEVATTAATIAQVLEQVRTLANRSLATDAAMQQIGLLVEQGRDLSARSVVVSADIVELGRRLASIHSSAPKRVSIDRAGDLIVISGDGDVTSVGRVCGQDGTSVASADTSAGRLVFLLTDGSRVDVGPWPPVSTVPVLAAAPVAPETALDDVLRPIAKKMHADGIPILKIRTMLGIGRPRLMRLLDVPA